MPDFHVPRWFDPKQPVGIWRKNLPHWEQSGAVDFLTFRLYDSMPQVVVRYYKQLKDQFIRKNPYPWDSDIYRRYAALVPGPMQKYLDAGYGSCVLKDPVVRRFLVQSIDYFENERILVWAYVIMPNHVHMLVTGALGYEVGQTVSSIMRYSARKINRYLGLSGQLWRGEPFDTLIRSYAQYRHIVEYIRHNPDGLPPGTYEFGGLEFRN